MATSSKVSFSQLLLMIFIIMLNSCVAVNTMVGDKGTELSNVQENATREQIETTLGSPKMEWVTDDEVHYCQYYYDSGRQSRAFTGTILLLSDIANFGLPQLTYDATNSENKVIGKSKFKQIIITYKKSIVQDVFEENIDLPDDARLITD